MLYHFFMIRFQANENYKISFQKSVRHLAGERRLEGVNCGNTSNWLTVDKETRANMVIVNIIFFM